MIQIADVNSEYIVTHIRRQLLLRILELQITIESFPKQLTILGGEESKIEVVSTSIWSQIVSKVRGIDFTYC